jgi:hypothetical protein
MRVPVPVWTFTMMSLITRASLGRATPSQPPYQTPSFASGSVVSGVLPCQSSL